ncbi:hypothetical protein HCU64_13480 [Methylobacterium sp. C25]|uniref:GCG_CRPN prefix-to-repeats domain-containing protein n=1 Tax=Methylobacterium sp. C25 TaxID=2721622 RepID=UPI001F1D78BB|nr:hypothetical protein [Methylobacterium sp. C25]MCE4224769.1 hypothetical protein [Methylobacterium sp. C25]
MTWKFAGLGLLALGTVLAGSGAAEARFGCGPGFHPNPYGVCRPNGPRFFGPRPGPRVIVGRPGPRYYRHGYRRW